MALYDIVFQSQDSTNFVLEVPSSTVKSPLDILCFSNSIPVVEFPEKTGTGSIETRWGIVN